MNNDHGQPYKLFPGYKPPPSRGQQAAKHLDQAKVLVELHRQNEALQTNATLQWSLETMRHIALFCIAGAAAAFAVMQVAEVKMPLLQGIAGALFLVSFGLCIYRMHRSAILCSDAITATQERLRFIGTTPSVTLEEIAAPLVFSKDQLVFKNWTYRLGWISAGFASTGAFLLIGTIIYKSIF